MCPSVASKYGSEMNIANLMGLTLLSQPYVGVNGINYSTV